MKTLCLTCGKTIKEVDGPGLSHGYCASPCAIEYAVQQGIATPEEIRELARIYEARYEPRAFAWGRVADIFVWSVLVLACLGFWFAVSAWACRGFEIVGR